MKMKTNLYETHNSHTSLNEKQDKATNTDGPPDLDASSAQSSNNNSKTITTESPVLENRSFTSNDSGYSTKGTNTDESYQLKHLSNGRPTDSIAIKKLVIDKFRNQFKTNLKRQYVVSIKKYQRIEDIRRILKESFSENEFVEATWTYAEKSKSLQHYRKVSKRSWPRRSLRQKSNRTTTTKTSSVTRFSEFPDVYCSASVDTSEASTLLSSDELKFIPATATLITQETSTSILVSSEHKRRLIAQAAYQNRVIAQLTRALWMCNDGKNASPHHLEAKKLILLASHKNKAFLMDLSSSDRCSRKGSLLVLSSLKMTNFHFKGNFDTPVEQHHFVLIVLCGRHVFATDIVTPDKDGNIKMSNQIVFENLQENLEMTLKLYHMDIKPPTQEDSKDLVSKLKKFLQRRRPIRTYNGPSIPSFGLWATSFINTSNLAQQKPFKLTKNTNFDLSETYDFDYSTDVRFEGCYSGFLTIATETETARQLSWNRYWCRLEGYLLKYYKYSADDKLVGVVDLTHCVNDVIEPANKSFCPKHRTLHVITGYNRSSEDKNSLRVIPYPQVTFHMHFLSADTLPQMKEWEKRLNCVLLAIQNSGKMKMNVRVSEYQEFASLRE